MDDDARLVVGLGNPDAEYDGTRHNVGWMVLDRLRARWGFEPFAAEAGCGCGCGGCGDGPCAAATGGRLPARPDSGDTVSAPRVWLVKPLRFMNRSGSALAEWLEGRPELGLDAAGRAAWMRPPTAEEFDALPDGPDSDAPLGEDEDPFAALADPPENEADRVRRLDAARRACGRMLVVVDDFRLALGRVRFRADGSDGGHNGLADLAGALGTELYPRLRVGVGSPPPGVSHIDWVLGRFADAEADALDRATALAADAVEGWLRDGLENARQRFNGLSALG